MCRSQSVAVLDKDSANGGDNRWKGPNQVNVMCNGEEVDVSIDILYPSKTVLVLYIASVFGFDRREDDLALEEPLNDQLERVCRMIFQSDFLFSVISSRELGY